MGRLETKRYLKYEIVLLLLLLKVKIYLFVKVYETISCMLTSEDQEEHCKRDNIQ